MTSGFTIGYVINALNHYAISIVLVRIEHPRIWARMVWLHVASSICPFLLSSTYTPAFLVQYPWTVHFGLYDVGKLHLQNPLLLIVISYLRWLKQFHGSEWAGSASTVTFFSCHALTFQITAKLTFDFPPSISLIISGKGCFRSIFLTAIFWKSICGKGQE